MIKAGQDPSMLITKIDKTLKKVETEVVDPILQRLSKLEDENLIAFRLSKEGYDNVYNIGEHWTYNMVQECQVYIDALQEHESRERRKSEHN